MARADRISTGSVDTLLDIEKVQFRDDSDSWTIQYQNRATELIGDHLTKMKGYESYKPVQEMTSAPGGLDAMVDFFLGLQVWGTPVYGPTSPSPTPAARRQRCSAAVPLLTAMPCLRNSPACPSVHRLMPYLAMV